MSEQKFEELLIGQLSSGIIGEINQSVLVRMKMLVITE